MKAATFVLLGAAFYALANSAENRFIPVIVDHRVDAKAFPKDSQYEEPEVVFRPPIVYPWEFQSGIAGEVVVYVKIDERGYPKRLAVFASTQQVFDRYAIANVMQTTWKAPSPGKIQRDGWFIRRIKFIRDY